ncbi:MAG: transporter substrate-binding domain-containing protein [Proteobacteria bacterium]|nr:transporter substrate-binding domain-containing protein [Pseudomonadota bacterium]
MDFTAAYVEIEATYLVPAGSPFKTVEEVDSEGTRIAVSARAAYDLYLTRSLKHAELVRGEGLPGAVELMKAERLDALAGLRPALLADMDSVPGSRVLDGSYTTVQQAAGTKRSNAAGAVYLKTFIEDAKASGLVQRLIDKHGVTGKLSVAPAG